MGVTLRAMVRGMGRNGEGGGIDCFGESGGVTFACVGPRAKGTHRARPGSGVKRRALPFHGGYGVDDWVGTTAYPDGLRGLHANSGCQHKLGRLQCFVFTGSKVEVDSIQQD